MPEEHEGEEGEGDEREGKHEERGLPRIQMRRSDSLSDYGLGTGQVPDFDHSTEIQCCVRWSWWTILSFGCWNLMKRHDCPPKDILWGLSQVDVLFLKLPNVPFTTGCFLRSTSLLSSSPAEAPNQDQMGVLQLPSWNAQRHPCWMHSLSTLTWPIPYLGNSTLDHSFFLVTATWLLLCLTHSHFPPCGTECVCMSVCVGCVHGRVGVQVYV